MVMIDASTALIKGTSSNIPVIRRGLAPDDGSLPVRSRGADDTPASWAAALRDRHFGELVDVGLPGAADVEKLKEQKLSDESIKHLTGKTTEGQTKLRRNIANQKTGVQKCLATTAVQSRKGEFEEGWPDAHERCDECKKRSRQCVMVLDERTVLIKGARVGSGRV